MKENQPQLQQDIAAVWDEPLPPEATETTNKHGGRVERRRLWVSSALVGYSDWPSLAQVCRIERQVTQKGKTSKDVAYAVTSLSGTAGCPERLLKIWRGHWGIENRLHWVRDVTFQEDRRQVRTGAAPQVVAAITNTAINLLRLRGTSNIAAALRRCATRPTLPLGLLNQRAFCEH